MADVISTVRAALGEEVVAQLARAFGEDAGAVRRGLDAAAPGALGSLTAKAQTAEGAAEVMASLRDAQVAPALLGELPQRLDGVKLRGRASGLGLRTLGERGPALAERIAEHAGIKPSTAASLVDLAAPLVLAAIAKTGGRLDEPVRVRDFLTGQEAAVRRAMPAGFEPFIGVSAVAAGGVAATAGLGASRGWLWWLLGLLILLALLFLILRACGHPAAVTGPTRSTAPAAVGAVAVRQVRLPDGRTVPVAPNTMNDALQRYLASDAAAPRTFVFETLHYNTDSSALGPEDQETVAALAAILAAYPQAGVRLDGHTDETGTHAANVALSRRRAALVAAALQAHGIPASRLSAEGHAETAPVAANATPQGRAQNRRTELTVTAK